MKKKMNYVGPLAFLAIALAAGFASADGNTIAASAKTQTLAFTTTQTLISGLDATDVCTTIINRSDKTAVIELTVTDDVGGTTTSQIAKSKSSALCGIDTEAVSVECLGPKRCSFTWSIDRF